MYRRHALCLSSAYFLLFLFGVGPAEKPEAAFFLFPDAFLRKQKEWISVRNVTDDRNCGYGGVNQNDHGARSADAKMPFCWETAEKSRGKVS